MDIQIENIPEGWTVTENGLFKEFKFNNFIEAFGFMSSVALIAEKMDHHPNWSNVYNTVSVHLFTHDKNAITALDATLAEGMNNLFG